MLREFRADDFARAVALLESAGLPTADLSPRHLVLTAEISDVLCGFIGLESCDDIGLLRSLIVDSAKRKSGIGATLVAGLEQHARELGIAELWLLTIDAERWFARHGYTVRQRTQAPPAIQSSEEFSSLCPGDAVLMSKVLEG